MLHPVLHEILLERLWYTVSEYTGQERQLKFLVVRVVLLHPVEEHELILVGFREVKQNELVSCNAFPYP